MKKIKKSDNIWIGYVIWVAFLVGIIALIIRTSFPIIDNIQFNNELKKINNFLIKLKTDIQFLKVSSYGSELKYYLDFKDGYIVTKENQTILQIWIKKKGKYNKNLFEREIDIKEDYDFLILSIDLGVKILNDLSKKTQGFFYLRNKGEGIIITDKKGVKVNLNSNITPTNPYLSWEYNFSFYYNGSKWEDIWLLIKDNYSFIEEKIYSFETLNKSILANFSNLNNNKSTLVSLNYSLTTDFGNFYFGEKQIEVPFNKKVNITFVFDNVKNASIRIIFNYLGKKYDLNYSSNCYTVPIYPPISLYPKGESATIKIIKRNPSNTFPCNITFSLSNFPTYANYSLKYHYISPNEEKEGKTYFIITPFIFASNDTNYWENKKNSFYFENHKITTKKENNKFTIQNNGFVYCWNGTNVIITKNCLDSSTSSSNCICN